MIFSFDQLRSLINESTALLTVQRGSDLFLTKVPRVHVDDLKMTPVQMAELDDWQHEAGIKGRLQDLYFIPYLLSPNGEVELRLEFVDKNDQEKAFESCQRCAYFNPLQEDDVVLAVEWAAHFFVLRSFDFPANAGSLIDCAARLVCYSKNGLERGG